MKFGLVEMDGGPPYGLIGKLALMFIFVVLIALIYHAIRLQIRYRQLWRLSQYLGRHAMTRIETGKWELAELSSGRESKEAEILTMIGALRREFSGHGPLSMITATNHGIDLAAEPYKRMTYHLKVLGWSSCLVGCLGLLSEIRHVFLALLPDTKITVIAQFVAGVMPVQLYGLAVGIACLWISSFSNSRLKYLYQNLSNRVLAASAKKTD